MKRAPGSYEGLTVKQAELLSYLRYRRDRTPSFDEMRDAMGLASKSGVSRLILALEERGYVARLAGRARCLEVYDERRSRAVIPAFELADVPMDLLLAELNRRMPHAVQA